MSDIEKLGAALETAGREFGKHSGPRSDECERATFGHDLRTSALRYARAYYAEARELGLIPEYERKPTVDYRAGILRILADEDMPGERVRKALAELVGRR